MPEGKVLFQPAFILLRATILRKELCRLAEQKSILQPAGVFTLYRLSHYLGKLLMKKLIAVSTSSLMAVLTAVGLFLAMWGIP